MKKILAFAFVLVMCLTTAACGAKQGSSSNVQETTVQSSTEKPTEKVTEESTTIELTDSDTEESADEIMDKPSELDIEPSTSVPKNNTWKKLYIDFLNSLDDSKISGYQLIYIDDDDIPELAAPGISHIAPSYLCWVNDDKLCQGSMSFLGFMYLECQNKYLYEGGFTGKGVDYVRRINGDSEEVVAEGKTSTITGQESYVWNGVNYPNQDEYDDAKNRDFNKSEAQSVNNLKSYTEICEQIRDY